VLRVNKEVIGWTFIDLKGISPSYCMHKIHMEQDFKHVAQPPRRLNPSMKEVVIKEVQKLFRGKDDLSHFRQLGLVLYRWCLRNEV